MNTLSNFRNGSNLCIKSTWANIYVNSTWALDLTFYRGKNMLFNE